MMNAGLHSKDVAELWRVVYLHLRSRGQDHLDAQDTTQEVFHQIMRRQSLQSFIEDASSATHLNNRLCLAARRVLADSRRRQSAKKRGSPVWQVETNLEDMPSTLPSPDQSLEEKEIRQGIDASLELLGQEMEERGQRRTFEALKPFFQEGVKQPSHALVARELAQKEATVRVIASRMRRRLRVLAMHAFA